MLKRRSDPSVALAKESMADTSNGSSNSTDTGQVDGQAEEVGAAGQGREGPGEGQRKMELIGGLLLFGEEHNRILEGEEDAGVDVEREVEVQRPTAPFLGVEVDLPDLAQGVCFDEMAFVVDVETVIDGVILQVGHVAGDVDGCHRAISLMGDVARPGRVLTRG